MKTAILIPAHNEAACLEDTLKSVVGQADVYVVSDNSTDDTAAIARHYTPYVLEVARGGRGKAIEAGVKYFHLLDCYDTIITMDADSLMVPVTVQEFQRALKPGMAGVVGVIDNTQGSILGIYRSLQHRIMARMARRGMATLNVIPIMSGAAAMWTTQALKRIDWCETISEDFEWTVQAHRMKLGRVGFAPGAIIYTQEPATIRDLTNQLLRWYRGYWLTVGKHHIPWGRQSLDFGQIIAILEVVACWIRLLLIPFLAYLAFRDLVLLSFIWDTVTMGIMAILTGVVRQKPWVLLLLPVLMLLWSFDSLVNLYSFFTSYRARTGIWDSPERLRTT